MEIQDQTSNTDRTPNTTCKDAVTVETSKLFDVII